jgi:hypothetical protein
MRYEPSRPASAVANKETELEHNLGFAASVAEFGMLLRQSPFKGASTWKRRPIWHVRIVAAIPMAIAPSYVRLIDLAASLVSSTGDSPLTRR